MIWDTFVRLHVEVLVILPVVEGFSELWGHVKRLDSDKKVSDAWKTCGRYVKDRGHIESLDETVHVACGTLVAEPDKTGCRFFFVFIICGCAPCTI